MIFEISLMNTELLTYTAKEEGERFQIFNYPEILYLKKGETIKYIVKYPVRSVVICRGVKRLSYPGRP
jgi:hypothetical protein